MRLLTCLAALLALAAAGPSTAGAEVLEELSIPTRDGDTIHVEIARPDGDAKVPIILTYTPYNALGGTPATNLASGSEWVEKGYARAIADLVGTRNSTGCWDYGGAREQRSGVDVVAALARQPWSNGKVGMTGVSYEGTTANMVAAAGDVPGLAAIVPIAAISRWYGYAYGDGVRYFANSKEPTDEGFDTPLGFDFGFGRTPPDRPVPQAALDRVNPCDSAEHMARGYDTTPDYDDFWLQRDYLKDAARFRVPVMVVHGLQDYNVRQSEGVDLFSALPVDDPATPARDGVPFKLAHFTQEPHADGSGDGYDERLERFFERTLKGVDNGIEYEDAVRVRGRTGGTPGAFTRAPTWPPPGTRPLRLELGRDGDGAGVLAPDAPDRPATASYTDAPPTTEELALADPAAEAAWLAYATAPLDADVRLAGTPVLRARVVVDGSTAHLTPTLYDLAPDGTATPISRGFRNLLYRSSLARQEPVPAGEPVDVTVRFSPQDQTVPQGHRIGVVVASTNAVWAVPDEQRRTVEVVHGASRLDLPVVGPPDAPPAMPGVTPAPPPATRPAARAPRRRALTVRVRRVRAGLVRVSGRAPARARLTIRLRRGKRTVAARRRVTVARNGRYAVRLRVRGRGRVRAYVTAREIGGRRLSARSGLVRPR